MYLLLYIILYKNYICAGFPSVGKSTLLSTLAGVYSEVAEYEFTTLTTVPGCIKYKGAKIQVNLSIIVVVIIIIVIVNTYLYFSYIYKNISF
jgi:GTPase involved in cell partitioning and DNA repair